jgi:hypothetical protein
MCSGGGLMTLQRERMAAIAGEASVEDRAARRYGQVNGADPQACEPDEPHPLAHFVPLKMGAPHVPEFLIDDVLIAGMALIVGAKGVGKTTALVPLMATCAHLCPHQHPLKPKLRRRVIYVAEDVQQVHRVLESWVQFGGFRATEAEVNDWFRVVPARRMPVEEVISVASEYARLSHVNRNASGAEFEALPVVVFDTRNAAFEIRDENSNSELSALVATLRQRFGALPVVIITHTPKSIKRNNLEEMTARGADALEADVQQVAYLFEDDATHHRYLHTGKHAKKRFESEIDEIEFVHTANIVTARDVMGDKQPMRIAHCEARPIRSAKRYEAREERKQEKQCEQDRECRGKLLDVAAAAWRAGTPLGKSDLVDKAGGNRARTWGLCGTLIGEGWLQEVHVPPHMRTNPKRECFIVALDAAERDAWKATGKLPPNKLAIPVTWRKPDESAQPRAD